MNYKQIHQALKAKGLSWLVAGEVIGCTHQHVMNVCARRAESLRVARSIAVLIEKDIAVVFPDIPRYQSDVKTERQAKIDQAKARLAEAGLAESA